MSKDCSRRRGCRGAAVVGRYGMTTPLNTPTSVIQVRLQPLLEELEVAGPAAVGWADLVVLLQVL